jgi:imidazolonepropionase-like amidohydrolase
MKLHIVHGRFVTSVAAAAIALAVSRAVSGQQDALVFTNITVIDATGAPARPAMNVVIRGGRIEAVGKTGAVPVARGARVVSGAGKFLIPGLWDMHVHLSANHVAALVVHGVTGVRDMGNILSDLERWRVQITAGNLVGPQIFRVGPILNGKAFGAAQLAITSDAEARTAVRVLKHVGVDAIKIHRALSRDAYFALADEAKKLSIPFVGHIPQTVTAAEASDAGQASLEHMETLFEGNAPLKPEDTLALFARLVKNNNAYTPMLIAYRGSTEAANIDRTLLEKYPDVVGGRKKLFGQFIELVGEMNKAGVMLMTGTDLGLKWISPGSSLHDELALLVGAGLTPMQALQAATRNPARLLKVNAGTVEAGQIASLVLLDANPLEDIRHSRRIRAVVVEGKLFDRAHLDALLVTASKN